MFSKLNYADCSELEHQEETTFSNVIPKNDSNETFLPSEVTASKLLEDLQENLEKMQAFEERILNRCMAMDMLCRNILGNSSSSESFQSISSLQFENDQDMTFAVELEKSLTADWKEENCSEINMDLAFKKLKEFFKELVWPQIVLGTASN